MKKTILKISCFLTGYNYTLLEKCSEDSVTAVKRYASGLWAILIIWLFIGFNFVSRYFKADAFMSIVGALFLACIILSLERFIILGHKQSKWVYGARIFIGCIMAFLGSIILDQIVFKYDIEKQKQFLLGAEARTVFLSRTIEFNDLINNLSDSKAKDSAKLAEDNGIFNAHPIISVKHPIAVVGMRKTQVFDTVLHRVRSQEIPILITTYVDSTVFNPIHEEIVFLKGQIEKKEKQIQGYGDKKLSLKTSIENELRQNTGFIDEQKALWAAVQESTIGMVAWLLFFLFFAAVELLIVLNKLAERSYTSDYETLVLHQKEMHEKKIRLLAEDQNLKS